METSAERWRLKRLDDNGNWDIMEVFESREKAIERMEYYQRQVHKQTYWVEKVMGD